MTNLVQYEYEGNLISFEIDEEIMINATEMAKPFKKLVADFLRLKQTKEYVSELAKSIINGDMGIPISSDNEQKSIIDRFIIKVIKGGRKNQGTWMHQELALKFAAWLSPKFEVWVFQQIKTLLKTGSVSLQNTQSNEMADLKAYFKQELAKNTLELIKN